MCPHHLVRVPTPPLGSGNTVPGVVLHRTFDYTHKTLLFIRYTCQVLFLRVQFHTDADGLVALLYFVYVRIPDGMASQFIAHALYYIFILSGYHYYIYLYMCAFNVYLLIQYTCV